MSRFLKKFGIYFLQARGIFKVCYEFLVLSDCHKKTHNTISSVAIGVAPTMLKHVMRYILFFGCYVSHPWSPDESTINKYGFWSILEAIRMSLLDSMCRKRRLI